MRYVVLSLAFSLLAAGSCPADVGFAFTPDGSPLSFNVNVGSTVDVPVYLVDLGGMTTLATDGLLSVGNRLNFATGSGNSTLVSATINPVFGKIPLLDGGTNFSRINAGIADISGGIDLLDPVVKGSSILVGTYKFQGVQDGNVLSLSTGIPVNPGVLNFNFTGAGVNLDPSILLTATTTVTTAIPEPSSFICLGVIAGLAGVPTMLRKYRHIR